jgi:hypothetical protein
LTERRLLAEPWRWRSPIEWQRADSVGGSSSTGGLSTRHLRSNTQRANGPWIVSANCIAITAASSSHCRGPRSTPLTQSGDTASKPQIVEYDRLLTVYPSLGYEIILLPKISVSERADFILPLSE